MQTTIYARPDTGADPADTTAVPADSGWAQTVTSFINTWTGKAENLLGSDALLYVLVAVLAVLLVLSLRSRSKRAKAEAQGNKAELTGTDRAVTRLTGILATAVVATGAWKVFGLPELHLHPAFRLMLFFFAEAQIVAAWRRVRRHIHRHATLGKGIWTIYGIALGSATVAAWDADIFVEVLLRFFAASVAAYMIAEELAEELDIHLTANPHLRKDGDKPRGKRRIKWALTLERVLVWLRLAEPSERTVEEVERQRRIARFARTAHRLHLLIDGKAPKWRIRFARWLLRRQTEAANEHLNLATDEALLAEVRAQLALLYGAEQGTSREAVADLSPLTPKASKASLVTPWGTPPLRQIGDATMLNRIATEIAKLPANGGASKPPATDDSEIATEADTKRANSRATKTATETPRQPAKRSPRQASTDVSGSAPQAAKNLAKWLAKYPDATNAQLAKRASVSERTVTRYRATAEAINLAKADPDDDQERPPVAPTFDPPKVPVLRGINGHSLTTAEEG